MACNAGGFRKRRAYGSVNGTDSIKGSSGKVFCSDAQDEEEISGELEGDYGETVSGICVSDLGTAAVII